MTMRIAAAALAACLVPGIAAGQSSPERLTLDAAIRLALANNADIRSSQLLIGEANANLAIARTRRLPSFQSDFAASQLLTPVEFAFSKGAFGTFPDIGPVPATDTALTMPRQPIYYVGIQVSQPLTQLTRLGLGVRNAGLARDLEHERARSTRLETRLSCLKAGIGVADRRMLSPGFIPFLVTFTRAVLARAGRTRTTARSANAP